MVKKLLIALFLFVGAVQIGAQESKARLFDEFPGTNPCGDISGRLDALLGEWMKNTDERIAVVYYSRRYRKTTRYGKNGKPNTTVLAYPHPDDGLNWAKGIPRYLTDRLTGGGTRLDAENQELAKKLREKVVLISSGYGDYLGAQIWLVPPSANDPVPTPVLRESDVKFGAKKPRVIPAYYFCYEQYEK